MNTTMNTTRSHKWIIVLVLALGLAVTSNVDGDVTIDENLDVAGDVTIDGGLDVVTGEVTVTGPNGVGDGGDAPDVLTVTAGDGVHVYFQEGIAPDGAARK